jgi:hypothetical protein
VISVYTTVFVGSTPVGGLIIGFIASRFGVDMSLLVGGLACVATGGLGLVWLRRINARKPARTGGRSGAAAEGHASHEGHASADADPG